MIIKITHNIEKGIRNSKEHYRLSRINNFIGRFLTSAGITRDAATFNGLDEWQIIGNLPELARQLRKYPTVTIS